MSGNPPRIVAGSDALSRAEIQDMTHLVGALEHWNNPGGWRQDGREPVADLELRGRQLFWKSSPAWCPPTWHVLETTQPWQNVNLPREERAALLVRRAMAIEATLAVPILSATTPS